MAVKAVLFDLDDTLMTREHAIKRMFHKIYADCYGGQKPTAAMEQAFLLKDNNGYVEKQELLGWLYKEYPPQKAIETNDVLQYWTKNFPACFEEDASVTAFVRDIKKRVKVGVVTNGWSELQFSKLHYTNLESEFEVIITSDTINISKPEKEGFLAALNMLNTEPQEALYVGDHLVNDIMGSQSAGMRGIWFNPHKTRNTTDIRPYAEITTLAELYNFL